MTEFRLFTLKDQAPALLAYGSALRQHIRDPFRTTATSGPGGVILPEGGFLDEAGAREWLEHVLAGRIGPDM